MAKVNSWWKHVKCGWIGAKNKMICEFSACGGCGELVADADLDQFVVTGFKAKRHEI